MKTIILKQKEIYTGDLILVNRAYKYHEQLSDLSVIGGGKSNIPLQNPRQKILFERRAGILLNQLMMEIGGWDHIVPVSGWRSLEEQQEIWNHSLAENGVEFTEKYVAVPGHSEHQTGLAVDLGLKQPEIDFIRPYFPYEGICQSFRKKAITYGFVERYPADKEMITQIGHEPWHFRYVGAPHAEIMAEKGLVLEEYIAVLRDFSYGKMPYRFKTDSGEAVISYVKAERTITELEIDDTHPYTISGNNVDGFIITQWRESDDNRKQICRN